MKKFLGLLAVVFLGTLLTGCVIVKEGALFEASKTGNVPDISAAYKNEKGEIFLLQKREGFNNSFTLTPPDKKDILTMEIHVLDPTENKFIFQLHSLTDNKVVLAIGVLKDQEITIHGLNPDTVTEFAKKSGVALQDGVLLNPTTLDKKLTDFFNGLFDSKYSDILFKAKASK